MTAHKVDVRYLNTLDLKMFELIPYLQRNFDAWKKCAYKAETDCPVYEEYI